MKIKLLAFGIARDILGASSLEIELNGHPNIGNIKQYLCQQYPDFEQLASLSLAVNTSYVDDVYPIQPGDEVVIIPPVSGG
jgi:molybdopterin converting factor subunit 1